METKNTADLTILDCTIRDGNYAVDFKFTAADTALLTAELVKLGFEWIEVGHGVGLGAMRAGKGDMPAHDTELIKTAKAVSGGKYKIGCFFIPGIGRKDDMLAAKEAGLDFIRIGHNAPDAEKAFPYIEYARRLGLIPCINMMKSYAVTPKEFGQKAKRAVEAGVEIVYCVDSAGSMLPDDVAEYFDETRNAVNCQMGFHGHNNLMMGIANCLVAFKHGVRFLDTTLCGLGRSAGNVPTEILIAVFERHEIHTGLDLFDIMNSIERLMWPMVGKTRAHDMLGVTAGYSQFHSAFLPEVVAASKEYNTDLLRLIADTAFHDPVNLDETFLQNRAKQLKDTNQQFVSQELLAFQAAEISSVRLNNSIESVKVLIDGLCVSAAKRTRSCRALHLLPSKDKQDALFIPEYVISDELMSMGRVTYGSTGCLQKLLALLESNIDLCLLEQPPGLEAKEKSLLLSVFDRRQLVPVNSFELKKYYLIETFEYIAQLFAGCPILLYNPDDLILQAVESCKLLKAVFIFSKSDVGSDSNRYIAINNWQDWRNLEMQFEIIVCGTSPSIEDTRVLSQALSMEGKILSILSGFAYELGDLPMSKVIKVNLDAAYGGIVSRVVARERDFFPTNLV